MKGAEEEVPGPLVVDLALSGCLMDSGPTHR